MIRGIHGSQRRHSGLRQIKKVGVFHNESSAGYKVTVLKLSFTEIAENLYMLSLKVYFRQEKRGHPASAWTSLVSSKMS